MAWHLSSYLVLTRAFQLVAALVAGSMNGFLIAWIDLRKLGLSNNMVIVQVMLCADLVHTTQALIGARSKQTAWLVYFLICDVISTGVGIGLITILARAGVPTHCAGLTRTDFKPEDRPERPPPGYSTIRFSNEGDGMKGVLDRFCAFERSCYFIAIGLIFSFMITIVLTILRICERHYTKNTRVTELLNSLERNAEKDQEQYSPLLATPTTFEPTPLPPLSEGIITRNTSVRSVATTARTSTSNPYRGGAIIPRRPVPNRTLSVIPSQSIGPVSSASQQHVRANSYDSEANDALIADGMQHIPQQQQQSFFPQDPRPHHSFTQHQHNHQPRHQNMPILPEEEGTDALVSDGMRRPSPSPQSLRNHQGQQQDTTKPPLQTSRQDEESIALVSDGMRPTSTLPPYTPGSSRMTGHAGEDNDTRLSEYVKGQTRAQDMKDSGGFN